MVSGRQDDGSPAGRACENHAFRAATLECRTGRATERYTIKAGNVELPQEAFLAALQVGDEAFFEILRSYYEQYQNSNATIEDFIAVAETVSGQDLEAFFDGWLYDTQVPGIPEMELTARQSAE